MMMCAKCAEGRGTLPKYGMRHGNRPRDAFVLPRQILFRELHRPQSAPFMAAVVDLVPEPVLAAQGDLRPAGDVYLVVDVGE